MRNIVKAEIKSVLKYVLALILLVLILRHAELDKITGYLRQIPVMSIVLAMVLGTLAQTVSALRMQFFFRTSGFPLNTWYAIILFYVGSFYNFLLPGGIGGDAYKVFLARKRMDMSMAQGIRIMVADRANGLCVLTLTMYLGLYLIDFSARIPYTGPLLLLAAIVTPITYVVLGKILLKQSPRAMLLSLPYSFIVQALWMVTLMVIWKAIGHNEFLLCYITLYCAASIVGVLPVSVGGLGIKEMTYYYGAKIIAQWAGIPVDPELGIAISLCLFAMVFVASLPGVLWLGKVGKMEHA